MWCCRRPQLRIPHTQLSGHSSSWPWPIQVDFTRLPVGMCRSHHIIVRMDWYSHCYPQMPIIGCCMKPCQIRQHSFGKFALISSLALGTTQALVCLQLYQHCMVTVSTLQNTWLVQQIKLTSATCCDVHALRALVLVAVDVRHMTV